MEHTLAAEAATRGDDVIETINPTTGEPLERYPEHDEAEIDHRLGCAWTGWEAWRETGFDERAELLRHLADGLEKREMELAELMTREMGKPITSARAELAKCAWVCRYYADHGATHLRHDVMDVGEDARTAYVRFDPLGPLLAIMPWNFPFWQLFRAAVPTVMAGNTVLLKHASNVPGCALEIERLFAGAGAPEGLFQTLLISGSQASELIADPRVRAVTLTGSVAAGRAVASQAGRYLKKSVLELGGSDAFVVLDDADLERAAEFGARSRLINNGESCIAAKRFIVVESVADDFVERLAANIDAVRVGDPMDDDTDVGPLAREDLRDDLHDQVQRSVAAGARVVTGGEHLDGPGYFYAPTVLDRVGPTMAAGAEETFGPAAAILRVADEHESIATANTSDFGLGSSVWTEDRDRGQRVAGRIQAGGVFVNQLVKSDPRVPFGGVKDSGYGRELGAYGIKEFVNAKTVWVE
jgi:succinate-semialdehyde dehydrogenase/glutarate-semialdehyde dehydrogenase